MQPTNDATPAPLVLDHREGGVAVLTMNRPERLNALDTALGRALVEALNRVAQDPTVHAVVLTGAGRGFCPGGDLNVLTAARKGNALSEVEALLLAGKQIVMAITNMPKPVVAAVNGPAAGAGCNLALACDLRIASDRATFTQSFVKIGLFPDFGGTYFLPRIAGFAATARLLYTGETISADEAARLGLVSRVVPHEALPAEVAALANHLAAGPPLVTRGLKQVLSIDHRDELERALNEEIRWQMLCFRSEDSREGLQAYIEKRPPVFKGK